MITTYEQLREHPVLKQWRRGPVIPAARTPDDFRHALVCTDAPGIILLFGSIITLPKLLEAARQAGKRLMVHLDLLEGIGRDKSTVQCLAQMGVTTMITTRPYLLNYAREEAGITVIQRLFLVDSEAVRTGIQIARQCRPDALEVLPAAVPSRIVQRLERQTGVPVLGGGLLSSFAEVTAALHQGFAAVSASKRELWQYRLDQHGRSFQSHNKAAVSL